MKTHPTSYSYNRARNNSAQAATSRTQGSIPQRTQTTHHQRKPNRTDQVPHPSPSPHTHNTAPTTLQGANSGRTDHRRQGKRKVSAMALTPTGHIIARDCLLHAPTLHWEGDRNDQCKACDELTECTRCNLVWHASCLHPTPIFPLRRQDAIFSTTMTLFQQKH